MTAHRTTVAAASTAVLLTLSLVAAPAVAERENGRDSGVGVPVAWNQAMVSGLDQAGIGGPPGARIAAIVQASVFDAVNGVTGRYTPYFETRRAPSDTSAGAAAIGAARESLVLLLPSQQATYDALLTTTLAELPQSDP